MLQTKANVTAKSGFHGPSATFEHLSTEKSGGMWVLWTFFSAAGKKKKKKGAQNSERTLKKSAQSPRRRKSLFQTNETGRRTPGFHRRQKSPESLVQHGTRRIPRERRDSRHSLKCNELSNVGLVDLDFNRGTGIKGDSDFLAIPVIPCRAMLQIVNSGMWITLEEECRF